MTQWSLWLPSRDPVLRWEKLPEVQASLQNITDLGFMAEWLDGGLPSVKVCKNAHKRLSDRGKLDSLVSSLGLSVMSRANQVRLITYPIPSQRWSMVVAVASRFVRQRWTKQSTGISLMKSCKRCFKALYWVKGLTAQYCDVWYFIFSFCFWFFIMVYMTKK